MKINHESSMPNESGLVMFCEDCLQRMELFQALAKACRANLFRTYGKI